MKNTLVALCVAVAVSGLAFGQAAQKPALATQAPDPLVGTWELNVAKSTFTGTVPHKSETRSYEVAGEGHKFAFRRIDAEGKPVTLQWTANYDGKDYPCTGLPQADTISMRRIDRFTSESTMKKAGKVVNRTRRVVSQDGKILTTYDEGTDSKGVAYKNVMVFDRK